MNAEIRLKHDLCGALLPLVVMASSTSAQDTTKKHVVRRIRFVTPDVAVVDIDNEVHGVKTMPAGIAVPPDGVIKTQLMEVFVRRNGLWWIEAYHNVDTKGLTPHGVLETSA
jgi:hypothetical protein